MHQNILTLSFLAGLSVSYPVRESPFLPGACPKVTPMPGLDLSLYQGNWRQVALFPNVTSPLVGSGYRPDLACVSTSYDETEGVYKVTNKGVDTETKEDVVITGDLLHTQEGLALHWDTADLPDEVYQVLDTDYDTFASVWNCKEFPMLGILVRREFAWIISREEAIEPTGRIPDGMLKDAMNVYSVFGIDIGKFEVIEDFRC